LVFFFQRAKQYVLESLLKTGGIPNSGNRLGTNQNNPTSFNDYGSRVNISIENFFAWFFSRRVLDGWYTNNWSM